MCVDYVVLGDKDDFHPVDRCGERLAIADDHKGSYEPAYTSYTHYWKTVLDYIFVIDPPETHSAVVKLLAPHTPADLEPCLPKKGISASDHVSLAVELEWKSSLSPSTT